MRIALVDNGMIYDSATAAERPLAGPERAVIGLSAALARAGHVVTVHNRCAQAVDLDGVAWRPLPVDPAQDKPVSADVMIVLRRPSLLAAAAPDAVGKRILWPMAPTDYLLHPAARIYMTKYDPTIAFISTTQKGSSHLRSGVAIAPGTADALSPPTSPGTIPDGPPTAVITTHPLQGLDWTLDLWAGIIRRDVPEARLIVVSALLAGAQENGGELPSALVGVHAKAVGMADQGVEIHAPGTDREMAALYRSARVHLYPGHGKDMACWTLAESQACGLPAVARPLGAVHERLTNGETGYIVPDAAAFANVAVQLLQTDAIYQGQAEQAARVERRRSWALVARDFELLCA